MSLIVKLAEVILFLLDYRLYAKKLSLNEYEIQPNLI